MEKIRIDWASKSELRSLFVFPKEQKLFGILREFLIRLGFNKESESIIGIGRPWSQETEEPLRDQEEEIAEYREKISNYQNKDFSVDIIYMEKSVAIIINSKKEQNEKIAAAFRGLIEEEMKGGNN